MKIISYSDLHLEFDHGWRLPADCDGDVLVLAGDIIVFDDFSPLQELLRDWKKPVLYVAGNHEYYTRTPMRENEEVFRNWLAQHLPQVRFLRDQGICLDGVHFFGGTMWTSFKSGSVKAMREAAGAMNDFRLIRDEAKVFTPADSICQHDRFTAALEQWFAQTQPGPHVVITHHAPLPNPKSRYLQSPLEPAFVSYEMRRCIERYAPALWIYGHTHECDAQRLGSTRILSNQLGYPSHFGSWEGGDAFDAYGCPVELS